MAVFTVIDHEELGVAAATWTSATIASSYDHLYLTISARSSFGGSNWYDYVDVQVNGETTGTNYSSNQMFADDSTPSALSTDGVNGWDRLMWLSADGSTADQYGSATIWIPNYANTTGYKQAGAFSCQPGVTTSNYQWIMAYGAGVWASTAAITSITIDPQNGDLMQYSSFTLYGITGA